jgi:hypothetical protein
MPSSSDIRAGAAYVELYAKDSALARGLDQASKKLKAFGGSLQSIGTKMLAVGGTITGGMTAAVAVFTSVGSQLNDMSLKTGASVEALSELKHAASVSGVDFEALGKSLAKMQKTLASGLDEQGNAVSAFDDLGLSVAKLATLAPDQQFQAIGGAISQISDPALRTAAAMQIFGKSGAQLLPLFMEGPAGMRALRQQARDLGLVMSTQTARGADQLGDAFDTLKSTATAIAVAIGEALLPSQLRLVSVLQTGASALVRFVRENKGLVVGLSLAGTGLTIAAAGVIGLGYAATALGTGLSVISAALGVILSPLTLITAGAIYLTSVFLDLGSYTGQLGEYFGQAWAFIKETFGAAFSAILTALQSGNLAAASQIAVAGLKVAWLLGVYEVTAAWENFKSFWRSLVLSIAEIGVVMFYKLQEVGISVAEAIKNSWVTLKSTLAGYWDAVVNAAAIAAVEIDVKLGRMTRKQGDSEIAAIGRNWEKSDKDRERDLQKNRAANAANADQQRRDALSGMRGTLDQLEKEQATVRVDQGPIEKARQELAAAKAALAAEVAKVAPGKDGKLPAFNPKKQGALNQVAGTFNPFAVRGLGESDPAKRTAVATEQAALLLKKIADKKGPVFGN